MWYPIAKRVPMKKSNVRLIKYGRKMKDMVIYVPCHYCNKEMIRETNQLPVCDQCEGKNLTGKK